MDMGTVTMPDDDPFLFSPDSEMWRINRERCGLIFGPAAAVLQIAHPRIAQGVHDHSNFRTDTLGRLRRTLEGTNRIAFGRRSEAEAMRQKLAAAHGRVRGDVPAGMSGPRAYSAFEPDLMVWVLSTLIWAAVRGYEFVYGEISPARKDAFHRDMCRFGTWFGVKEDDCPVDWKAFSAYFREMIEGELLASHPVCREMAEAVVHPRDSMGVRLLGRAMDFLPIETLPALTRERLGLHSNQLTRLRMHLFSQIVPTLFPRLPPRLRYHPEYLSTVGRFSRRSFGAWERETPARH